ncbi:hypothetical protein [Acidovorax facilis]|jgi:hypothetical protein|uniref:hypothetical protein n=1 Tax=Acidovorax facilis TaxID=12917 RepID=UPI003D650908
MAEFIYRSTSYGPQTFTVPDSGGIVEKDGKRLSSFGGYLVGKGSPLLADAGSLEAAARRWWRLRTGHLFAFGHKANGVLP